MADLAKSSSHSLARPSAREEPSVREFLVFELAGEAYGVELPRIREIVNPPPLTEVPRAPSGVLGICSVRGLLVTVVDLRRRIRLEERPTTRRSRILLANADSGEVIGLFVDEVRQVARLAEAEIELATNVLGSDLSDFVLGIGRPSDEIIILLDMNAIVTA